MSVETKSPIEIESALFYSLRFFAATLSPCWDESRTYGSSSEMDENGLITKTTAVPNDSGYRAERRRHAIESIRSLRRDIDDSLCGHYPADSIGSLESALDYAAETLGESSPSQGRQDESTVNIQRAVARLATYERKVTGQLVVQPWDERTSARNEFIYNAVMEGKTLKSIVQELTRAIAKQDHPKWRKVASESQIGNIARDFASHTGRPDPPSRQPNRKKQRPK